MLPNGLYGMADASFGDPVVLGRHLMLAGVRVVQLRAKAATEAEILQMATALMQTALQTGALLIVNDNLTVASRVRAHGLHLGQDDGPPAWARRRLGPDCLIGLSTHDPAQVLAARDVDYLGFGPVFGTQTKDTGYAPRGLQALAEAVGLARQPVVAIGGITVDRLPAVKGCGVAGWEVGAGLWLAADPAAALAALMHPADLLPDGGAAPGHP